MDEAKQIFVQEAEELLEQMEDALLSMEGSPDDPEYLNSVFRAAHTIKGSGGIFGFDDIVTFTHPVETELDKIRSGEKQLNNALIAWLLECKDHISQLIEHIAVEENNKLPDELAERGKQLLSRFSTESKDDAVALASPVPNGNTEQVDKEHEPISNHWLISLDFKQDSFRSGLDPLSFLRYLSNLGEIAELVTVFRDTPNLEQMDFESCYLSFRIGFLSDADKHTIADVFSFAEEDCDIRILAPESKQQEYIDQLDLVPESQLQPLGEMLVQVGALTRNELVAGLHIQKTKHQENHSPIGEILINQQSVNREVVEKAVTKQEANRKLVKQESHAIRVDAKKLGQLIDLVGELVIASSSMRNQISRHHIIDADEAASNMERLVEEIRDNALQLRMVPIGETFSRFKRVVRDVSQELNKDIELCISGGESELDKSVVEKLNDPLTHLIRNALDHGIEIPESRIAAGKPAKGKVSLNAFHDSGHIVVEISDDGAGLNLDRVRQKAEAIGLIRSEQVLTRQELLQLIFEPGLSTKKEATNLSGRGVGMDVVKRNIEALRGSVELDSESGKGTKVSIRLPLTLAIIDGFLVGVGGESYIIPLSMVEECVEFGSESWHTDPHCQFINLRDEALPFIRLKNYFGTPYNREPIRESLVVVRFGRQRAALVVEELLGEQQTVIKPLGTVFQHLIGISGATVLGSGEVALILDIQGLVDLAIDKARERNQFSANNTPSLQES